MSAAPGGSSSRRTRPVAVPSGPLRPPAADERPLFVDEVHARLPKDGAGRPRFSQKWVRSHVAPEAKRYAGRLLYWLERDVLVWEREYFGGEARRRPGAHP